MKIKTLFIITIIILGALLVGCFSEEPENNSEGNNIGEVEESNIAPDFTLTTLDGNQVSLSDYKGKKVLLNFWATWCSYCRSEMPEFQELTEEHGDRVEVLAVNIMQRETVEGIRDFVDNNGYTFKVLLDEDNTVSNAYRVRGVPANYLINSEGEIVIEKSGPLSEDEIDNWLND